MSQVGNAVEDEHQEDLAFSAGFETETPPEKTATIAEPPKVEDKPEPKAEPKTPATAPKVEPKSPAPEYVQLTKADFERMDSAAKKTATYEAQFSKVFGTMGEMQQTVKKLQSATPAGQQIELPPDVVSEMETDFPELAGHIKTALQRALKGLRGTGQQATAPVIDKDEMQRLVRAESVKNETEALEDAHPNWREIVGPVDSEGKPVNPAHPFRAWLAKQPADYQFKVNQTNSAVIISRAIDKFKASQAAPPKPNTPAPKVVARQDRIRGAVQPKGDGGQPAPRKTDDDHFAEGFREG